MPFWGGASYANENRLVPFQGTIDEVRISKIARYESDFTPPPAPFPSDSDTLALYHFDEGAGDVLNDSSGNGHHGKIVNAKWVPGIAAGSQESNPQSEVRPPKSPAAGPALDFSARLTDCTAHVDLGQFVPRVIQTVELYATPHTAAAPEKVRSLLRMEGLELKQRGSQWIWHAYAPGASEILVQDVVRPGTRVHLAAVATGQMLRLFQDGRLLGERQQTIVPLDSPRKVMLGGYAYFDPGTLPFEGTIDEVRISSAARYTTDFTPPTRFEADADTLALYHFEEGSGDTLIDSSDNENHGKIVGGKWVLGNADGTLSTRAMSEIALDLSGRNPDGMAAHVKLFPMVPAEPMTVEMYATPRSAMIDHDFSELWILPGGYALQQRRNEWVFLADSTSARTQASALGLEPGRRVHLAGVSTGRELRLFVNGRMGARMLVEGELRTKTQMAMLGRETLLPPMIAPGRTPPRITAFDGTVDELRISKVARYDADFTLPARFESDADTLALYHFDEGSGATLTDSSGNENHGEIVGAKWVPGIAPGPSQSNP